MENPRRPNVCKSDVKILKRVWHRICLIWFGCDKQYVDAGSVSPKRDRRSNLRRSSWDNHNSRSVPKSEDGRFFIVQSSSRIDSEQPSPRRVVLHFVHELCKANLIFYGMLFTWICSYCFKYSLQKQRLIISFKYQKCFLSILPLFESLLMFGRELVFTRSINICLKDSFIVDGLSSAI